MDKIQISFFLNKEFKNIIVPADITALEYIREYSGLTGTKLGCGEGDCGSCTIGVGTYHDGAVKYMAVNSCLMPVAKMQHKHIITIEGLANDENNLHPIQQSIVENHATQCGFCTPGINMSLFCYLLNNKNPELHNALSALEGNLCRCTGYESIKKVAEKNVVKYKAEQFTVPYYFEEIKNKLSLLKKDTTPSTAYYLPHNTTELFNFLKEHKQATIINGGTDIMVNKNIKGAKYNSLVDISEVNEFHYTTISDQTITIGANITLNDIINNKEIETFFPILKETLSQMASEQIRNIATLSGNICNASPVADTAVILMAAKADLLLASSNNTLRKVNIKDFYLGYKKIDIKNTEVLQAIEIPTERNILFSFEKTSKRKAVDISTVNSAISISINGNTIEEINIAFGGIAPTPIYLTAVNEFLTGKQITEKIVNTAANMAIQGIRPITDMRGTEQYRILLVKNHIIKHFHKLFPQII